MAQFPGRRPSGLYLPKEFLIIPFAILGMALLTIPIALIGKMSG